MTASSYLLLSTVVFLFEHLSSLDISDPPAYNLSRSSEDFGFRIVGGSDVGIEQAPYQVSLQLHKKHICGGALVTRQHVLTAAHCTYRHKAENLRIRAGSTYHDHMGLVIDVEEIINHSNYSYETNDYDISVLKLQSNVPINKFISTIPIAKTTDHWRPGIPAFVTGWGHLMEAPTSKSGPRHLQGVVVKLVDVEKCKEVYGDSTITDRMLCAGVEEGGKDACGGDSGGPLLITGVLAGVVSFGQGCARKGVPGVYGNVPAMRRFIAYAVMFS